MLQSVYITRFISGLLLMVFTLSITPKRFLHNVFATHIDATSEKNNDHSLLSKGGYNCDQDNLVAESTYEAATYFSENTITSYFKEHNECERFSFASSIYFSSLLRGPPVSM